MKAALLKLFPTLMAVTGFFGMALPATAADLSPREIAQRMDKTISGYDDQQMDLSLLIYEVDGSSKKYDLSVYQKGDDKRYVTFTNGEMKGMRMLSLGRDNMFVYLPGMKRIRRVAAHGMSQSLAGSDFTSADMSGATWADAHDFILTKEENSRYFLRAVPKSKDLYYASADLVVLKETFWLETVTYNDAKGQAIKVMESKDATTFPGGAKRFKHVTMRDARTGHKTVMELKTFTINQGLPDSMFTERQLQWGR